MKKIIAIAGTLAMAAALALPAAPAAAQSLSFGFGFGGGPSFGSRYDGPRFWPRHHHHHRYHRGGPRVGLSFDLGPVDIRVRGNLGHISRCEAHCRSYDRRTDMYLGYDGDYHRCRL
jgi:hypothetical protein